MPKHSDVPESLDKYEGPAAIESSVQTEVPEDAPATDPIITPDTPPIEASPADPAPTPVPEADRDTEPEPDLDDDPVVEPSPEPEPDFTPNPDEPSPEPPAEEYVIPEGDKPIESIPVGSKAERAVTYVSQIEDPVVRALLMQALADQKVFSKDTDLRYRMQVADSLREMIRWIRTNVPGSASYKTFMEGVNTYLLMVESQGIPSMWSEEAANAPLDEIQARKAAMAIERAVETLAFYEGYEPVEVLRNYAQQVREGKIK